MFRSIISEEYEKIGLEDLFSGESVHGFIDLFNHNDFVVSTKGKHGETYIYVDPMTYSPIKKELELEFIIYEGKLYLIGHRGEVRFNQEIHKDSRIVKFVKSHNIEVANWSDVFDEFEALFKQKYISYLIYGDMSMTSNDKYSSMYEDFVEENLKEIKEEAYSYAMQGNFNEEDLSESFIFKRGFIDDFTMIDVIKYHLYESELDSFVLRLFNDNSINNNYLMRQYLYNTIITGPQPEEIKVVKNKVNALKKAGKTVNVLVDDEWVKVNNVLLGGYLSSSSGEYYELEAIESIKFNGNILY